MENQEGTAAIYWIELTEEVSEMETRVSGRFSNGREIGNRTFTVLVDVPLTFFVATHRFVALSDVPETAFTFLVEGCLHPWDWEKSIRTTSFTDAFHQFLRIVLKPALKAFPRGLCKEECRVLLQRETRSYLKTCLQEFLLPLFESESQVLLSADQHDVSDNPHQAA